MSKTKQTKKIEFRGLMKQAKQHHKKTKNFAEPHTEITIAVPLMDNRKFEEMCFCDGYQICFKMEYIPNKHFSEPDKESQSLKR